MARLTPKRRALATERGIPATIPITDDIRYCDCKATEAVLVSIEGDTALYKGVCDVGHEYDIKLQARELQQRYMYDKYGYLYGGTTKELPSLEEY